MFATLRRTVLAALIAGGLPFFAQAATYAPGHFAEQQLRHIATYFPGRMSGSPAELMTADYLQQQFTELGYKSNTRQFNTSYNWLERKGETRPRKVSATSVIAARAGAVPQEILIVTHLDTWTPLSRHEADNNLGGLRLQGVDDNASGLGVMLELAQQLSKTPLHYGVRFVALSAGEAGLQGMDDYLSRMSAQEKKNTLLVIDLNSLIVGDHLYFNSGANTPSAVRKQTSARAVQLAHRYGISAASHTLTARDYPGVNPFDKAGMPLLDVTAANWALGNKDGQQQRAHSSHFPEGNVRHQTDRDNLNYLDRWLPGRITQRTRDSVKILLPLVTELANPTT
ncbi:aminopeptidase [Pantoea sp. JGM49]|uniref:aminopeptidase n=1 Tax=unclassified Pantoea TaxID=2630326 RepID=UPI000BCB3323|nr:MULTISPECIES: aminopeptidase [unclassified Pantoea]MBS0882730.1 aminopeptidase [Pantoea sp. JGM49]SNY65476.1 alkaline phosphatase isozyme conversion protein [Pantoea sp. GL120224-02]